MGCAGQGRLPRGEGTPALRDGALRIGRKRM